MIFIETQKLGDLGNVTFQGNPQTLALLLEKLKDYLPFLGELKKNLNIDEIKQGISELKS